MVFKTTFRTLANCPPAIRGTALGMALCLMPGIFAQTPTTTTLVTSLGQKEIRASWNFSVTPGSSVSVSVPDPNSDSVVIENISLEIGGSGAQTTLVQFIVNQNSSHPRVYYFLLSPTTTFAGGVPIGVLNQSTKVHLDPGDTLVVTFNGSPTVPATIGGTISGYLAPYLTSLPF